MKKVFLGLVLGLILLGVGGCLKEEKETEKEVVSIEKPLTRGTLPSYITNPQFNSNGVNIELLQAMGKTETQYLNEKNSEIRMLKFKRATLPYTEGSMLERLKNIPNFSFMAEKIINSSVVQIGASALNNQEYVIIESSLEKLKTIIASTPEYRNEHNKDVLYLKNFKLISISKDNTWRMSLEYKYKERASFWGGWCDVAQFSGEVTLDIPVVINASNNIEFKTGTLIGNVIKTDFNYLEFVIKAIKWIIENWPKDSGKMVDQQEVKMTKYIPITLAGSGNTEVSGNKVCFKYKYNKTDREIIKKSLISNGIDFQEDGSYQLKIINTSKIAGTTCYVSAYVWDTNATKPRLVTGIDINANQLFTFGNSISKISIIGVSCSGSSNSDPFLLINYCGEVKAALPASALQGREIILK